MILHEVLFPTPLRKILCRVCIPTIYATDWNIFLSLKSSAVSGTASSNKSAHRRSAAGTIFSRQNGIQVLAIPCASAPNPCLRFRLKKLDNGTSNLYLSWSNNHGKLGSKRMLEVLLNRKKQDHCYRYIERVYFYRPCLSSEYNKKNFQQRLELQFAECLKVQVLSSAYNVPAFSFEINDKQRSIGNFVSSTIRTSLGVLYIMRECMRTMS